MDLPLRGTLILAALVLPYAAEVTYQVWLQARFLAAVPPGVRAGWPRHPRRAWLSFIYPGTLEGSKPPAMGSGGGPACARREMHRCAFRSRCCAMRAST